MRLSVDTSTGRADGGGESCLGPTDFLSVPPFFSKNIFSLYFFLSLYRICYILLLFFVLFFFGPEAYRILAP